MTLNNVPQSSHSFSSDLKLLYGVISVFYVQSQVLRPPLYDLVPDHTLPAVCRNLVSLFLSLRAKERGISLKCKFRIVPSVSGIKTTISLSHPQLSRGRFSSHALNARTCRHTPLCVDFHKLFPHNVISGNQLDGIFWDDDSSDESHRALYCRSPFPYKGCERECREKEQEEETVLFTVCRWIHHLARWHDAQTWSVAFKQKRRPAQQQLNYTSDCSTLRLRLDESRLMRKKLFCFTRAEM